MSFENTSTKAPSRRSLEIAQDVDKDVLLLESLGYKQELRRHFTPLQIFGVGFSIVGLVSAFSSVLIFSIPSGGPVAMVWGWLVCAPFLMCIGLALAELSSAAPTSGGLYYWTFKMTSERWRCYLSWVVGYANTIQNIASVASIDWGCAVQIMAGVSMGSNQEFEATTAQTYGLFAALIISHMSICILSPRVLAKLQMPFTILNVLLCLVVIVALPVATLGSFKNTPKFALGELVNFTEWPSWFAFILSFLTPAYSLGCFDAPIHMSEEVSNSKTAISFAIVSCSLSSLILGFGINVALAFSMGTDLEAVVNSPIGQPMATIFFNSFGQKGALAVWAFVILVQYVIGIGILTTCSRQIFAFARDGGLPFSRWIYFVDQRTFVPSRSVLFGSFGCLILGLLAFAGPTAISAVFSLVVTGQYVAYSIPICARFFGGGEPFRPGPFTLGVFGGPVATIAVGWMTFMSVILYFPASTPNVEVSSMNYAVVVQGGVLVLATVYFFAPGIGGRNWFSGPVRTVASQSIEREPSSENQTEKEAAVDVMPVS